MGTVTKKSAPVTKAKPAAPVTKTPPPQAYPRTLVDLASESRASILLTLKPILDAVVAAEATASNEQARQVPADHRSSLVRQDVLHGLMILWNVASDMKKGLKTIEDSLIAYKKFGGPFEHGKFAIQFPSVTKCSPKWKEEALQLAKATHEATNPGIPFNEEAWIKDIQNGYPSTTSTSVDIVESA